MKTSVTQFYVNLQPLIRLSPSFLVNNLVLMLSLYLTFLSLKMNDAKLLETMDQTCDQLSCHPTRSKGQDSPV